VSIIFAIPSASKKVNVLLSRHVITRDEQSGAGLPGGPNWPIGLDGTLVRGDNRGNRVYVSRQLGHANPSITLNTYAHLFGHADHAATAREALDASYAAVATSTGR
jgi:integrase